MRINYFFWLCVFALMPLGFISGYSIVLVQELVNDRVQAQSENAWMDLIGQMEDKKLQISLTTTDWIQNHRKLLSKPPSSSTSFVSIIGELFRAVTSKQLNVYSPRRKLVFSLLKTESDGADLFTPTRQDSIYLSDQKSKLGWSLEVKENELVWVYLREIKIGTTAMGYLEHILVFPKEFFQRFRRTKGPYFFAFAKNSDTDTTIQLTNLENTNSVDFASLLALVPMTQSPGQYQLTLSSFQGKPFAFYSKALDSEYSGARMIIATAQTATENWRKSLNMKILSVSGILALVMMLLAWLVFKTQSQKEHKLSNRKN